MSVKEKLEKAILGLRSLHRMLNTKLPPDLHQKYINEVLEALGEQPE